MSLDTDLRAALAAYPAVTALVGSAIVSDRMEQGTPRPYIVFIRADTQYTKGLDGTIFAERSEFDVQCWADTRASANAVADAITTMLDADQRTILSRTTAYDPDLDLEATLLSVEWWD